MLGEDEDATGSHGQCQFSGGRKTFWRSASWSSSRTSQQIPSPFDQPAKDSSDGGPEKNGGQSRRFPVPLTPRSQLNSKARSCLPPLQPLSIARRSLDEWPKAGSDDVGEWPQPPTPSGKSDQRLKLDISSFQRNPDPTGSLVKRDKIAFFDKECSKVVDHIYLGGDAVAKNREILRQNGITHVLNCVGFVCPEYFKSDLVYKTLWLQDSPSEDITSILYDVFDYFEDVREQGGRVLVHCCQGVSRSTSLVIAYVMWREGQSFDDAFQYVKAARGITNPNMGFACQLLQCQKRVHAIPLSPSSVLRVYRMAPHSPYDALHLVPKMLNDPSPTALDSRGAFIIHVPSAIYVWIGKDCELIMERDARGAACQVVRYERVQGPIIAVHEGEEPSDFWDAFSNVPLSLDSSDTSGTRNEVESTTKVGIGKKKVDLYDVDYELFRKAITGGVVPPFSSPGAGHETHLPARESNWSILRRKFVSGTGKMKERVSVSRAALCRVYSDSMLMVDKDNRANKVHLMSSQGLNSPPYLSPSSLSSDSSASSKYTSESPTLSPSHSRTPSPASSNLCDSLPSSSKSPNNVLSSQEPSAIGQTSKPCSKTVLSPGYGHASKPCSKMVSLPSKGFGLSIAERRGNPSPPLKLPNLNGDSALSSTKAQISFAHCVTLQEATSNVNENLTFDNGSFEKKGGLMETCGGLQRNNPSEEGRELSILTELPDNGSDMLNLRHPLMYRWPDLKQMPAFGVGDLDPKAVFFLLAPSSGLGKHKSGMLYLWIGSCFECDDRRIQLGEVDKIDWNRVGSDFLTRMGLPKDIPIEVVKEDESEEFLQMLSSL